jgi:hypothetical protein
MVPGSTQQKSGLSAASGVHDLVVTSDHEHTISATDAQKKEALQNVSCSSAPPKTATSQDAVDVGKVSCKTEDPVPESAPIDRTTQVVQPPAMPTTSTNFATAAPKETKISDFPSSYLSEEEKLKVKKKRRKRKLLRLARRRERERLKQQNPAPQHAATTQEPPKPTTIVRKKPAHTKGQKKKGPRSVEYICALCSETYSSTCDYNPWWALAQHDCPKCRKAQV